jgi:Ca2+-binding RTX toxin-like protein
VIDRNGALVLAGSMFPLPTGEGQFAVGRFTASGDPDTSFSADAKVVTDVGTGDDSALAVALDPVTGRIVAGGSSGPFATSDWGVARYEGVPRCGGKVPTMVGTPGNDNLKGTAGKDVISGGAGNDTISGLGKADTLCGEDGKDKLKGGKGNDRLIGGAGKDKLFGNAGKDKLKGGAGKDVQKQ